MRFSRVQIELGEHYVDAFKTLLATYTTFWEGSFASEFAQRRLNIGHDQTSLRTLATELRRRLEGSIVTSVKRTSQTIRETAPPSERVWSLIDWDVQNTITNNEEKKLLHDTFCQEFDALFEIPVRSLVNVSETGEHLAREFHSLHPYSPNDRDIREIFEREPILCVKEFHHRNSTLVLHSFEEENEAGEAVVEFLKTIVSANKIFLWFGTSGWTNSLYLALPFLIMHEYLSHVFTIDEGPGKREIVSRAFLEGWMDFVLFQYVMFVRGSLVSIEPSTSQLIGAWGSRVTELEGIIYERRRRSGTVYEGFENAHFVCRNIGWEAFVRLTQQLAFIPSDHEKMKSEIGSLKPEPEGSIHQIFMEKVTKIRLREGDEDIKKLGKKSYSIVDWWSGINNLV